MKEGNMNEHSMALGLDVSKLSVDACLLQLDGQKRYLKIPNTAQGFKKLIDWLHGLDQQQVHACLEPTGRYSRPLALFLYQSGIPVSQVNSFAVQNHGRSKNFRSKNDRIDAFLLADFCLKHNPPVWSPPPQSQSTLRDIQHRLVVLDEMIRQEENRLEAGTDSDLVRIDIEDNLGRLYIRRKRLEQAALDLVRCDELLEPQFNILCSIIGIGTQSAIRMLALLRFEQFRSGRQMASFAGLAPREHQSGSSIHLRCRISKVGNCELRAGLYFPAMVAMRCNPQLRDFADRLRAKNKPPKVIICAVMRKLLVLAAALIRKQELYNPELTQSLPATS